MEVVEEFLGPLHCVRHGVVPICRLCTYRSAWDIDNGKKNTYFASIAKALASEVANKSAADAVQVNCGAVSCGCGAVSVWCRVSVVPCQCGAVWVWCRVSVVPCQCGVMWVWYCLGVVLEEVSEDCGHGVRCLWVWCRECGCGSSCHMQGFIQDFLKGGGGGEPSGTPHLPGNSAF